MSEERLNATRPEEEQLNGVVVSAIQSLKKKRKKKRVSLSNTDPQT